MEQDAKIDAATAASELTLALLFLNRFREKVGPNSLWRAWKGFDFDTLDKLAEAGLISSSRTAKSVYLTDEGLAEARRLLEKYGIADKFSNMVDIMNNEYELAIKDIPDKIFSIPHYQRGYRWTEKEVEALLNDLLSFARSESSEEPYCLQPLVLQETTDGKLRVVDGQQRLTTLAIILQSIGVETKWDIEYTAEGGRRLKCLLKNPGGLINDHFRIAARNKVKDWLYKDSSRAESLRQVLNGEGGKNVIFLRYDLPRVESPEGDKDEGQSAFRRLNDGKTPLTSSELIRALYMEAGNGLNPSEKADIAKEWDLIESAMADDQFWTIWNNSDFRDVPTRMDFLFSIVANVDSRGARQNGLLVYSQMEDLVSKEGLKNVWEKTLRCWWWMQSCYSEGETYHLLGWLAQFMKDKGTRGLWSDWENDAKCRMNAFKQKLRGFVVEKIGRDFDSFRYDEAKPAELRGLFVLLNSLEAQRRHIRFRFDLYRKGGWDIEHIASQTDKPLVDAKDREEWLGLARNEMSEDEVRELDGCTTFDARWKKIWDMFPNDGTDDVDKNGIGNLALLDSGTNRAYKNAIFPAKRRKILGRILEDDVYIPPATEAAFTKSYSAAASQMRYWSKKDAEDYREGMKKLFDDFLKNNDGGAQ